MTRRERRTIEQPTGYGQVFDQSGDLVADVEYDLLVEQEILVITDRSGVTRRPVMKDASGHITLVETHADTELWSGGPYVLHLEDGRHWRFLVDNPLGDTIDVTNASSEGLFKP